MLDQIQKDLERLDGGSSAYNCVVNDQVVHSADDSSQMAQRQQTEKPPQSIGIAWYRDMLRALVPLHELEIAHANVRIDDFLCHSEGAIVLYDFTCSRLFGQDNPSATGSPESLGVTGPPQTVSDPTDRFALASVMFEVETGAKGDLTHAISPQNSQPWKAVTRALIW
ncbi:hypothetical protein HO173_006775 [Letharia columbiana]|uniref:Protein kinase domain-containing protein n=1 Tax=Letharia columbiana TaxID=112416 RepID=A0A8H6FUX3_9LECA|nr:uncharacterized protein HO173_006775 [Letharia columbiana]KAF6235146.1 hypothetical protein HO173_006775 [Letharia columbiana]